MRKQLLTAAILFAGTACAKDYIAYIGTYTNHPNSKGIYAYRWDPSTGNITSLGLQATATNPSFVAADPEGKYLFAVNEIGNYQGQKAGSVSAYTIDRTSGKLTFVNTVSTRGAGPCHLMVDKTGKMLVVANYDGGSVASFPIQSGGRIGEASSFDQHQGKGTNPQRQEAPHGHCSVISPNNKYVAVADLGLDKVFMYKLNPDSAAIALNDPPSVSVPAGSGPRHFAFHPDHKHAYVINEMGSTITAFNYEPDRGSLNLIQTISTLSAGFTGKSTTAEIEVHPSGKFVYGSNRGHDSIAVFAVDRPSGKLSMIETVPTQGKTPRSFAIDPSGRYLFAANQDTDNIVLFKIDQATGKLTPAGKTLSVGSPVSIIFVPMK
jgi:6-phosphogluconolactonase